MRLSHGKCSELRALAVHQSPDHRNKIHADPLKELNTEEGLTVISRRMLGMLGFGNGRLISLMATSCPVAASSNKPVTPVPPADPKITVIDTVCCL